MKLSRFSIVFVISVALATGILHFVRERQLGEPSVSLWQTFLGSLPAIPYVQSEDSAQMVTIEDVIKDQPTGLFAKKSQVGTPSATTASGSSATGSVVKMLVTDEQRSQLKYAVKELVRLEKCYQLQNCDFDQSTPTKYEQALQAELVSHMQAFADADNVLRFPNEAQIVARHFLKFPNDDIKENALKILEQSPTSTENCRAVISALEESASSTLYTQGLGLLKSYVGTPEQRLVDAFVIKTVESGPIYPAREVARRALSFMSESNLPEFERLMKDMSPRSLTYRYLKSNHDEYMRMQKGGLKDS